MTPRDPTKTLREQIESTRETVQEFEAAAEYFYQEGKFLVRKKQHYAGIYLLGYAAEMWLKTAYFRLINLLSSDTATPQLPFAVQRGRNELIPPVRDAEGYHNLLLWWRLILLERNNPANFSPRRPFNLKFAIEFQTVVLRSYDAWWIQMRYRSPIAATKEAEQYLKDVEWIRENHDLLWR